MCGIVGAVAHRKVHKILLEGLKRLEYRGYDSAGLAILEKGAIERVRQSGKVSALQSKVMELSLEGTLGIAHTRWATHGEASEQNAHPHMSGNDIALVHNGIIDNFQLIKIRLESQGYCFETQTDTEVIAHLIDHYYQSSRSIGDAVHYAVQELEGAYALAVIHRNHPDSLICTRQGAPLVIGVGFDEHFIASDTLALSQVTHRFIYLEEHDLADITAESLTIYDKNLNVMERKVHTFELSQDATEKGPFKHYMLKEIYEQPQVIQRCLEGRIVNGRIHESIFGQDAKDFLKKVKGVQIVACGTSYHAGMVAKYWIESLASLPCQVEVASEFRYRNNFVDKDYLFITLSQSGETADTLAALRKAKLQGYIETLTICNVPSSTMVREAGISVMMNAGPEIGVASTKAFPAQLVCLIMIALVLARSNKSENIQEYNTDLEIEIVKSLQLLPTIIKNILNKAEIIKKLSLDFIEKQHALYLGRGAMFPIALEGALKLKEISYIHAEAYPAGELKHGPLALVDNDMPVIAIVPNDELLSKLKSNLEVIRSRGGVLYVLTDKKTKLSSEEGVNVITLEEIPKNLEAIVFAIPLQLLAYYIAVIKGTDIDQPRNLAKSVTVE